MLLVGQVANSHVPDAPVPDALAPDARGVPRGGDGGGRRPLFEMLTYNFLLKIAFYSEKIVL